MSEDRKIAIDEGGPAFPLPIGDNPLFPISQGNPLRGGMSLRDFFAAVAMQGLLAANSGGEEWHNEEVMARKAFSQADAMITERKKV